MKTKRAGAALTLLALGLLVLVACGRNDYAGRDGSSERGLRVSESQSDENWPLNVRRGALECLDAKAMVFHHGGETYAMNAPAAALGYTSITPLLGESSGLGRDHYDLAVAEGVLSPNIRSYEQFLTAFKTTAVYFGEYPELEERFLGELGPMLDLALTLC
jgi:hypothetical protein